MIEWILSLPLVIVALMFIPSVCQNFQKRSDANWQQETKSLANRVFEGKSSASLDTREANDLVKPPQ
jgi:hypothetical protein